ncbi:MAG: alpha-ribazole phosphatase [Caulobacteraceae bacterium]
MTELYLIRHGETELNVKGVYYGWTDCCLSERGLAQAEELSDILQDVRFDVVVSSNLKRAIDTAVIVSDFPTDGIIMDERLRELNFGAWEGLHFREVQEKHREAWELWGKDWINASPPSGESFKDIYNRVKECIGEILTEYKGKRILVVSHQGTMRLIPMILLGLPEEGYWSFTAEHGRYSLLQIDEAGRCIVRKINCGR